MTRTIRLGLGIALAAAILFGQPAGARAAATPTDVAKPAVGKEESIGLQAAQTVSMVTGVAISPLMGVGAVGAYKWWKTPAERRASLPWFARPVFWIPALFLVAIVALKDLVGTAAPTALKKPFDAAEVVENKISALVAAGAFIPLIISIFPENPGPESGLAQLGFAAINAGWIGNALLVPFALVAFGMVWLASHAINILILISPFTIVDTGLKTARLFLLSLVTGLSFSNPYVGAAFCVVIIIAAYFLAGWSFRLSAFGTLYVWDLLTFRRRRFQPGAEANWMFTASTLQGAPIRTYGRLRREGPDRLVFEYRPWLFLAKRLFVLPEGNHFVGRGIIYDEIRRKEKEDSTPLFILPPRYHTHEEALARVYNFAGTQDIGLLKGMKAMWAWIKDWLGNAAPAAASSPT